MRCCLKSICKSASMRDGFTVSGFKSSSVWETIGDNQSHRVEVGARVHGDLVHRNHTERSAQMIAQEIVYVEDSNIELLDSQVGAMALALYAYDDWTIGKFHLFPSLRNETIQTTTDIDGWKDPILRSILLPGMGTMWEFDDWLDIFASAHKGFSPVAPEQQSSVLPEVAWNYEIGLRQHLDETTAEVIVFANDYKRIAGQCTLSSGCDVNDLGRQFTGGQKRHHRCRNPCCVRVLASKWVVYSCANPVYVYTC